jgi:hypothetical protein
MKKYLTIAALAVGAAFSSGAIAQVTTPGQVVGDVTITVPNCTLLSSDVRVTISAGNQAAFSCNTAGSVITAGACSANGANRTRTVACSWSPDPTDPTIQVPTDTSCGTDPNVTPTPNYTITGRAAFVGQSTGGRIGVRPIGADCNPAAIAATTPWPAHTGVQ